MHNGFTLVSKNHDILLFEKRSTTSESTLSLIRVFLTVLSTIHCTSIEEIRFNKKYLLCNRGSKKCGAMFPDMVLGVCGRLVYIRVEFLHNPHESLLVVNIVQGRNHL